MKQKMAADKKKILVVLVAGIGDLVLASPAFRALRNGYPAAEIHLLTSAEAFPLARNYPYLNRVRQFPIREIKRNRGAMIRAAGVALDLRREKFDMAVNLYRVDSRAGAIRMGLLFTAVGAASRVGHAANGFEVFLTHKVPDEVFNNCHVADSMMEVAVRAGGVGDDRGIEVFWDTEAEKKWSYLFESGGAARRVTVGLNPGGHWSNRRWPAGKFAAAADTLAVEFDADIIILGGPGEEQIADNVGRAMSRDAVNMVGRLDLNGLAYVCSRLDLLITNDSGPMHIAAAAGAPLVAVFGPENPDLFGPRAPADKCIIISAPADCRPCGKTECDSLRCLNEISVDQALDAARALIKRV